MQAKYATKCPECGREIQAGEEIKRAASGRFAHAGCVVEIIQTPLDKCLALGVQTSVSSNPVACDWKRCRQGSTIPSGERRVFVLGSINRPPRLYHPDCFLAYKRASDYAREAERARGIGYSSPRELYAAQRARREQNQAAEEERANLRYWKRVDNQRELGYQPD